MEGKSSTLLASHPSKKVLPCTVFRVRQCDMHVYTGTSSPLQMTCDHRSLPDFHVMSYRSMLSSFPCPPFPFDPISSFSSPSSHLNVTSTHQHIPFFPSLSPRRRRRRVPRSRLLTALPVASHIVNAEDDNEVV